MIHRYARGYSLHLVNPGFPLTECIARAAMSEARRVVAVVGTKICGRL